MSRAAPGRPRIPHLDGLRALAALFVVVDHTFLTVYSIDYHRQPTGWLAWATSWMTYAHLSVVVFIVISGYSLALGVRRTGWFPRGIWDYVMRRARRILPPYWAALILCTILILTLLGTQTQTEWDHVLPLSWPGLAINAVAMQDIIPARSSDYVLWSVAIEWHIYFAFPVMLLLSRRIGWARTSVVMLALGLPAALASDVLGLGFLLPFVLLFYGGVLACLLAERPTVQSLPWGWITLALGAAVLAGMGVAGGATIVDHQQLFDLPVGAVAASLLLHLSRPAARGVRFLQWRPLVAIGIFSYSVYLMHAPLIQLLWQYVVHPLGLPLPDELAVMLFVGVPLAVSGTWAFFLAFERPFLRPSVRAAERRELEGSLRAG